MKEFRKLLGTIATLALSIWLLAIVVANPTAAAAITMKVFLTTIGVTIGLAIYNAIKGIK